MKQAKIQQILVSIKDTPSFQQALTHSSRKNESPEKNIIDYENMEFLGDSILGFQVSSYVYQKYPHYSEGQMSKLKQFMVQEKTLASLSKEVGLANYLKLGTGEEKSGGRHKVSILADIFESFVAALYLEKGMREVRKFLNLSLFLWAKGKENEIWDHKTQLQELCQAQHNRIFYRLIKNNRETTDKHFIMEVYDELGKFRTQGQGKNKKSAEQEAAYKVLKQLKKK